MTTIHCLYFWLQVLTMEQAAQVLVNCEISSGLAEDGLPYIAQAALPSVPEVLTRAPGAVNPQKWQQFWQYAESMNPYLGIENEHVPISHAIQSAGARIILY